MTLGDDGWSGTNFDRPAFQRLLGDIEAGRVNMVLTKDLSRLGRDYILTGHYLERYFPEKRVRYLSLLDGIDTGVESTANDITPFRAIMNDMYAKDISRKIRSVKREQQRRGLFIGGKPVYGYRMHPTEKNRLVIDERAALVVRRIFSMALEGISCRQIALRLNAERVPPPAVYAGLTIAKPGPYTGLWSGERISEMLQNETYIGNMVQGRQAKLSYKSKKCLHQPRKDWVVVAGTHEPLIDRESFEKVQVLVASRRHTRSRSYDFPLRGLLFCRECGHPLGVVNRKNAAGEDRLFLICRTYQRFPKAGVCTCHCVKESTVTQAVAAAVREVCGGELNMEALLPQARQALSRADGGTDAAAGALRARIEALTARLDQMYLDKLSGLLSEADFRRVYQKLQEERARLEEGWERLRREAEAPASREDRARGLTARFLEQLPANRELLFSLIQRVELATDKQLTIRFRFAGPGEMERPACLAPGDGRKKQGGAFAFMAAGSLPPGEKSAGEAEAGHGTGVGGEAKGGMRV